MAKNKRNLIIGAIAVLGASAAGAVAILKKKKRETVFRETSMDALEELESFMREDTNSKETSSEEIKAENTIPKETKSEDTISKETKSEDTISKDTTSKENKTKENNKTDKEI